MPLGENLTQVIFGSGLPDAMQNSCRSRPSSEVASLLTLVKLASAIKDEKEKINALIISSLLIFFYMFNFNYSFIHVMFLK